MPPTTRTSKKAPSPTRFTKVHEFEMLDCSQDFQVIGKRGWFHFIALVTYHGGDDSRWVDAADGRGVIRSFSLDKIKRDPQGEIITRPHPVKP